MTSDSRPMWLVVVVLLLLASGASASAAGLDIEVDSGLSKQSGRLLALGDLDGDLFTDLVVSTPEGDVQVLLYSQDEKLFVASESLFVPALASMDGVTLRASTADFDYDGRLDLLVSWLLPNGTVYSVVERGALTSFDGRLVSVTTTSEPLVIDIDGDMHPDIVAPSGASLLKYPEASVVLGSPACAPSTKHPHGFVDVTGDCAADMVVVCEDARQLKIFNYSAGSWSDVSSVTVPEPIRQLAFADVDQDGAIDVVILGNATLRVLYNEQTPFCNRASATCRDFESMCAPYAWNGFADSLSAHVATPLSMLLPGRQVNFDAHFKLGDLDRDGTPEIVLVTQDGAVAIIHSTACVSSICAAEAVNAGRRIFVEATLDSIPVHATTTDVAVIDYLEDGLLDLVVIGTVGWGLYVNDGSSADYFVKAIVSNGACAQYCASSFAVEQARSLNHPGVTVKLSLIDELGQKRALQVVQGAQSSHGILSAPYAFAGIGRTSNYVSEAFVGVLHPQGGQFALWRGIIPNARLVVFPYYAANDTRTSDGWQIEVYIPSRFVGYVAAALVGASLILALAAAGLTWRERREDARERRRAIMMLNFDAL